MISSDHRQNQTISIDAAEALAIQGLSFLAADEDEFLNFLALSGLTVGDLRSAAQDRAFLAGVLDFILGNERTLINFAQFAEINPASITGARNAMNSIYG